MQEHTVENQQNNLVAILKQHDEDEEANIPQTRIDKANAAAVKLLLEIKKPKVSKLSWARSARSCAKSLEDLLVVGYDSETAVMRELLNAKKLWNTVTSNPARAANAELLQHPFGKCWEGWILAQVEGIVPWRSASRNYASTKNALANYWKHWRRNFPKQVSNLVSSFWQHRQKSRTCSSGSKKEVSCCTS